MAAVDIRDYFSAYAEMICDTIMYHQLNKIPTMEVIDEQAGLVRHYTNFDNLLGISWVDSSWIPILNSGSVLDYFSERSNPFYDRTCNNEVVKMQRLTLEHLNQMVGVEYILLHAQEPILFIIRKQQRQSPTQVIPLADYYIIAGVIYQAPDLGSVINSRVLTAVHGIQSAFDEAMSYCRYHPSKGYWWHFKDHEEQDKVKPKVKRKEEPSSIFQRQRVDALLLDLRQKFPPKFVQSDPSGAYFVWKATAMGKNYVNGKTFLEKRYNEDLELEDAIHTVILTLKESFEGHMTEDNIEVGICNEAGFRRLSPTEVKDYLAAIA
ncbi:hypothetical protein E5288_WYG004633 [Bos mutus]|uniref:Mediator of RNA polymerase II transcription subunit 6 n=1 Tax=Bos mutus TaxID=72004 RepID=A0A6B0RU36_9CETA|nr:hypothetical protein [Bos mutus]